MLKYVRGTDWYDYTGTHTDLTTFYVHYALFKRFEFRNIHGFHSYTWFIEKNFQHVTGATFMCL